MLSKINYFYDTLITEKLQIQQIPKGFVSKKTKTLFFNTFILPFHFY